MKLVIHLLLLLAVMPVSAAPKKKALPRKSPARQVSSIRYEKYNCNVVRHTREGDRSEKKVLKDVLKFEGIEKHEEITMTNKDGEYTVSVNAFIDTPATPYMIDTFTCDDVLNCRGGRQVFSRKNSKTTKFQITSGGYFSHGVLGSQDIFRYSRTRDGFAFDVIHTQIENEKYYGVEVDCTAL